MALQDSVNNFLKIYSSKDKEMKDVLSAIYVGFSRTAFTGNKVKDFYRPPASAIKPKLLSQFLKENGIKLLNIKEEDLKKELEGKVVKTIGKFPTELTVSYGIIRADIHFEKDVIILGRKIYKFTAGDPNFWRG